MGVLSAAMALKVSYWADAAYAQQTQRVNVAQVGGIDPAPAICDNSTSLLSSAFLIRGTAATNTVVITASTAKSFVCALDLTTDDSTVQIALVSGDSTDCSTNSTITIFNFSSKSGMTRANGGNPQWKPISSNSAVCIKTASSGPVFGSITFARRGD
jgi:hypothetical protein